MNHYPYSFDAKVDKYDFGKYFYTVVYIPQSIVTELPLNEFPRLRINAQIDGLILIEGALTPDKLGSPQTKHLSFNHNLKGTSIWYLLLSKKTLKAIKKEIGSIVQVRFNIADQDHVEIPAALQSMLDKNQRINDTWKGLSAGKKRSLVFPILNSKTSHTLNSRLEILHDLLLDM